MIEDSIRTHALTSNELTALIGNRFYLNTKHNSGDNYVVMQLISDDSPVDLHFDKSQKTASVQIDCYSKSASNRTLIAKAIKNTFHTKGFIDSEVNVQFAIEENSLRVRDIETDLFRATLDYTFNYNEV